MAITISNETGQVKIVFSNKTIWVPKPYRTTLKEARGTIWLNTNQPQGIQQGRSDIEIQYSKVTSPTSANISDLADLLAAYNNQSASGTFTNADLTAGVLTITHNLGTTDVAVVIRDPDGLEALTANTIVDGDSLTVDFGGAIGAGTWTWFVLTK